MNDPKVQQEIERLIRRLHSRGADPAQIALQLAGTGLTGLVKIRQRGCAVELLEKICQGVRAGWFDTPPASAHLN